MVGWMDEWIDGWIDEWVAACMNAWKDRFFYFFLFMDFSS